MTMLEKVARAIAKENGDNPDYVSWTDYESLARAALVAVRGPDEGVDMAGAMVGPDTNAGEFSLFEARMVFSAMIDAILNESEETT